MIGGLSSSTQLHRVSLYSAEQAHLLFNMILAVFKITVKFWLLSKPNYKNMHGTYKPVTSREAAQKGTS
jgi:hypothetical protein